MEIIIKKVLSHGTNNPVVARLLSQTQEFLPLARFPKEKADQILQIYFELTKRLLKVDDQVGRMISAFVAADREMTEDRNAGRHNRLPQIVGVEGEAETFLYDAKNFLRELVGVINVFFDEQFEGAGAWWDPKGGESELVRWAAPKFGKDDPFTVMLASEQPWVSDLVRKRNAVEHPGGRSGRLNVENITRHPSGKMVAPTWWLNFGVGQDLIQSIETGLINLCTLAEDILVSCLQHSGMPAFIVFYEIPVEQRDKSNPKRLALTIDHGKVKPPMTPPAA